MNNTKPSVTPRLIIALLAIIVIAPLLPLLITGRWNWWEAWAYALIYILGFIISRALAARHHPDILAERARMTGHADTKEWDKTLSPLVGLVPMLIPLLAGLDARLGWSQITLDLPAKLVMLAVMLGGYALASYALIENRFFSGVVRIQTDRDHHVVSSGPYRWLRHPGYAGALLTYIAVPFWLDALWALLPVVVTAVLRVIRTRLEDQTLQDELPGYREYAGKVRYRLLPGVW